MNVNYEATVTSSTPAKVWATIGGVRVYPDLTKDTVVKVDQEQTAGGVKYFRVVGKGWSKAEWFSYKVVDTNPPPVDPPPPPPPTGTKKVVKSTLFFDDNSTLDLFPK